MKDNLLVIETLVLLIILMLQWEYQWKPIILGYFRDELFSLRDNRLKNYFIENSSLADPLYINARNLINANIRYLEHASLTNLYLSYRKIKKSNIQPDMDYQLLLFLFSDDEKMTEFLNGIRAEAGINVFLYCALINPISFTTNLLVAIFLIVKTMSFKIIGTLKKNFYNAFELKIEEVIFINSNLKIA